jgi:type I restriction enzyme S subunit
MSFPRYPEYKDSGVEWLGEVPAHWEASRLKRVVDPTRHITYGIVQAGPNIPDGIPYVRPADMSDENGVVDPDGVLRTSPEIASAYTRSMIREGDLVCSIGPSFGKVMVTPDWLDGGNLTQGTARIAVQPPSDPRFIFWVLRAGVSVQQWESSVGGATFRALNLGPLCETAISLPPPAEQTDIAAFLDRETAKIDALVAEQRRLIELLKEKRQAVISHAVTKGLNPDAPMKDSGIEWLGEVPEGWEVPLLSRLIAKADLGGNYEASESGGGIPLIKMGNLGRGVIKTEKIEQLSDDADYDPAFRLETGDFLFNTRNSLDLVGKVAIWRDELPDAIFNSNILRIKFNEGAVATTAFMNYFFNSDLGISQLRTIAKGTTSVAAIYYKDLTTLRVILPPRVEQRVIVGHLDEKCAKLDTLTAEAQRAIDLLQERRTALISAAVTGQIDVRQIITKEVAA